MRTKNQIKLGVLEELLFAAEFALSCAKADRIIYDIKKDLALEYIFECKIQVLDDIIRKLNRRINKLKE